MGRFLIYFSYFGTRYSGVQEQRGTLAVKTVGGILLDALKHLQPSNEIKITLSSRTDKGVHALANTCHVDLVYPCEKKDYSPTVITNVLNYHLKKQQEDIRIVQTKQVADTFHCRFNATGRKYVYRLGHVLGSSVDIYYSESMVNKFKRFPRRRNSGIALRMGEPLNVFNGSKAVIYRTELDIGKLVAAAEMLSGIHNYLSFTTGRKETEDNLPHPVKMLTIGVKRGQPFGHRFQKYSLCEEDNIEFWDIHVQSRSFMYRQVRRLVGAMVLVARNIITLDDLRDILDNPKKEFSFSGQMSASEEGLFLLSVDYTASDLQFSGAMLTDSLSEQPELSKEAVVESLCGDSQQDDTARESHAADNDGGEESDQVSEDKVTDCLPATQTDPSIVRSLACSQGISQTS
ncbi:hypothetical protein BsWGS_26707 [Bradybaena similaris]